MIRLLEGLDNRLLVVCDTCGKTHTTEDVEDLIDTLRVLKKQLIGWTYTFSAPPQHEVLCFCSDCQRYSVGRRTTHMRSVSLSDNNIVVGRPYEKKEDQQDDS